MTDKEQLKALGDSIQTAHRTGMGGFITLTPEQERKAIEGIRKIGMPGDRPATIELKERPSLAELWKDHDDKTQTIGFSWGLIPGMTGMVVVPVEKVQEWEAKIEAIRAEVAAHGLHFEAVISNPGPEPWKGARPIHEPHTAESIKAGLDEVESLMEPRRHRFKPIITVSQHIKATEAEQELRALLEDVEERLATEPVQEVSYTSQRMKGLDELQRQLATAGMRVKPYLNEDVHIESCPVIGKEPPLDLSDLSI